MQTAGFVYLIDSGTGFYKIGKSTDPEQRLWQLDNGPIPLKLVHVIASENYGWLEAHLHRAFAPHRVRGEWFKLAQETVAEISRIQVASSLADIPDHFALMENEYHLRRREELRQRQGGTVRRVRPGFAQLGVEIPTFLMEELRASFKESGERSFACYVSKIIAKHIDSTIPESVLCPPLGRKPKYRSLAFPVIG